MTQLEVLMIFYVSTISGGYPVSFQTFLAFFAFTLMLMAGMFYFSKRRKR